MWCLVVLFHLHSCIHSFSLSCAWYPWDKSPCRSTCQVNLPPGGGRKVGGRGCQLSFRGGEAIWSSNSFSIDFSDPCSPLLQRPDIFYSWNFPRFSGMNMLALYCLSSLQALRFSLICFPVFKLLFHIPLFLRSLVCICIRMCAFRFCPFYSFTVYFLPEKSVLFY